MATAKGYSFGIFNLEIIGIYTLHFIFYDSPKFKELITESSTNETTKDCIYKKNSTDLVEFK